MHSPAQRIDLLRPVARWPQRFPFLLQSNLTGPQGRYDFLFGHPGERLVLWPDGRLEGPHAQTGSFLAALDAWFLSERVPAESAVPEPPFAGGWFLYLGYELAAEIEPVLSLPHAHLPLAMAVRVPSAILWDRWHLRAMVVDEAEEPERLAQLQEAFLVARDGSSPTFRAFSPQALCEAPGEEYLEGVHRILRYIREGDVFQVNLSRRWEARFAEPVDPLRLYAVLRHVNPGPFNGLALFDGFAVLSSSPERLVEVRGESIRTRPIAGTRPRSRRDDEDLRLQRELLAHPKEQAEHVMLIDLERNDLGRVCRPGSVHVGELMTLESYAHVHHIVSEVAGRLRSEVTPGDVIRAVFPGGTITGCPKVRCMEIIAELEGEARGSYTGAVGYLDRRGHLDLNILIRTMVQEAAVVHFRTGAGIVADSDPERELVETRAKALGLLKALGMA